MGDIFDSGFDYWYKIMKKKKEQEEKKKRLEKIFHITGDVNKNLN